MTGAVRETSVMIAGMAPDLIPGRCRFHTLRADDPPGLEAGAEAGIACNVGAGHHHHHLFVPRADADRAVALLRARA